jgi:hypothetical protein
MYYVEFQFYYVGCTAVVQEHLLQFYCVLSTIMYVLCRILDIGYEMLYKIYPNLLQVYIPKVSSKYMKLKYFSKIYISLFSFFLSKILTFNYLRVNRSLSPAK